MKNNFIGTNFIYELKKITPLLWTMLICIFILINILFSFISINKLEIVKTEEVKKAINDYLADSSSFNQKYDEWSVAYRLYEQALLESAKSSNLEISVGPPTQIYNAQRYDFGLYDRFFSLLDRKNTYKKQIKDLIDTAKQNVSGSPENSYAAKYNKKIIEIYTNTSQNIYIGLEDTRGWDFYLESPMPGISTIIILVLICGYTFCLEYGTGMNRIIFSSRYGKRKIFLTKLIYLFFLSFFFLFLSEFITLFITYKTIGLSSPWNSIQAFPQYTYCPYNVSVLTYAILSFATKLVVLWTLCIFTAVLSIGFQKMILVYTFSIFISTAAYVCLLLIPTVGSLIYRIHPFTLLTSTDFFKRYSASHLFNNVIDHTLLLPTLYCATWTFFLGMLFMMNTENKVFRITSLKEHKSLCVHTFLKTQEYSLILNSLILTPYEIKKQLQIKSLILFSFLILTQAVFTHSVYSKDHSVDDHVLQEYLLYLEGPISVEKTEYLLRERTNFDKIFSSKNSMEEAYSNGTINSIEYFTYLQDYERALSHTKILDHVISYDEYLNRISLKKTQPAHFIYPNGYENLLNSGSDVLILLAIVFLATDIFSCEYTSKTSAFPAITLISSTKYGRTRTTIAKYLSSFTISSIIYLSSSSLRLIILYSNWYFTELHAPLYSLEQFRNSPNISIFQFLLIYFFIRLFFVLILVNLILTITKIIKKGNLVFWIFSIWLLSPYICEYFSFNFPYWLDFNFIYNNIFRGYTCI